MGNLWQAIEQALTTWQNLHKFGYMCEENVKWNMTVHGVLSCRLADINMECL